MKIDRTGTFLVTELDRAMGKTSKAGLPQLTITVMVTHWFDEALNDGNGDWIDFSNCFMEDNAYCTLAYRDKSGNKCATFQHDHLMETYGWDGKDYGVLATMAAPEMFQIRVKDNDPEYADKNPYVIDRIAPANANPHGGLKKLDIDGINALNIEFASVLNKAGKAVPPVSAKKSAAKAPPKIPATQTTAEKKASKKVKSEKIKKANEEEAAKKAVGEKTPPAPPPTTLPAVSATPEASTETTDEVQTQTKQEAYEMVFEMQAEGTTDDQRNIAWNAAIKQIAGDVDQKEITGEQWYKIMHETLNDVGAV